MAAWIFQDAKQVAKHGGAKASWFVGWFDPDGKKRCKSCGPGSEGAKKAERLKRKTEAELLTGTYHSSAKKTWSEFRKEFTEKVGAGKDSRTWALTVHAFDTFERICKPKKMSSIKTQTFDGYVAHRRLEPGKKKGDTISPASVNKELRHLRAAINVAVEWGYMPKAPKVRMMKEPGKLPRYVPPDDFAKIYGACDEAKSPYDLEISAADWWRGLLMTAYLTGWRIGEMLALRREDVDLDKGTAITWHEDNKGKRDDKVPLHPVVVEHLRKLVSADPCFFPWNQHRRMLHTHFARIQRAAKIELPCRKKHGHTAYCHVYSFHDLRRAYATMNADRLSGDALQALMRHKSYATTQRYISMARQLDGAVANIFVPDVTPRKEVVPGQPMEG